PAHLCRADHDRFVDAGLRLAQPAEVAGQIGPVDLQPVLAEPGLLLPDPGRVHRRGRKAFAGQLGGDPLPDLRLLARIDQRVQLALAEEVDEPGGDRQVLQLDAAARLLPGEIADGDDPVPADPHVGAKPWRTGAVDHPPAGEHQIEDRRAEESDHACGATTITPSSPSAPSTTARTGSACRAIVASSSSPEVTSLAV